jgi:gamma-glutamylcyclotransferase (GGCT)/AIG2-like uncharacterized protein YtfP
MSRRQHALFSYGTLRLPQVQQATYGRLLEGEPDALTGFALRPIAIDDPAVIAASGLAVHHIAYPSGDPADRIEGVVFALTDAEIAATDRYESGPYVRIAATLESGRGAWVYVSPDRR